MKKLNPAIKELLLKGTLAQRHYIFDRKFIYFCLYYFPHYFKYPLAPFHWDFVEDAQDLADLTIKQTAWITFRESAKTSYAKMLVLWYICHEKKKFINWDSFDGDNSESALYDVVTELQTNQRLIADYGHLFYQEKGDSELAGKKPKKIGRFVTENGIRVEAYSTQESARGRVHGSDRPDFFIFDDIETNKTKDSYAFTYKIRSHVDEVRSGLGPNGSILYLGNYITDDGVIEYIINGDSATGSKGLYALENARVRFIPVMTKGGSLTWPGKYTKTNAEAIAYNANVPISKSKVSLEAKREELGDSVFETEMLNNPGASGDYYGDREIIKGLIEDLEAKNIVPKKVVGGARIWREYKPSHRYAWGADTAEGIGGDSNTLTTIDFSTRPARTVLTYDNNETKPSAHGHVCAKWGFEYGEAFGVPEINLTGYATVSTLVDLEYFNMYTRQVKNKTSKRKTQEYGFKTTTGSKPDIVSNFFEAVESGELEILDINILKEMYNFKNKDVHIINKQEGMTKHFDLLMSAMLGWEGRKYARVMKEKDKTKYKSPLKAGEYNMA